jgi:hypothetical protein
MRRNLLYRTIHAQTPEGPKAEIYFPMSVTLRSPQDTKIKHAAANFYVVLSQVNTLLILN